MKPLLILFALFSLASCATVVTNSSSTVREATTDQVRECAFIQTISVTSPFYGVFAGSAMQDLRNKAFAAAEATTATHLVLGQNETNQGSTTMHAKAYRC